jgi:hypothetical protein
MTLIVEQPYNRSSMAHYLQSIVKERRRVTRRVAEVPDRRTRK